MCIEDVLTNIINLNLKEYEMVRTKKNSIVLFKSKYKYTDCVYIDLYNEDINLRYERVFDNKYLDIKIERLLIKNKSIDNIEELIRNLKYICL